MRSYPVTSLLTLSFSALAALSGCGGSDHAPAASVSTVQPPANSATTAVLSTDAPKKRGVDRDAFNHAAFAVGESIFWEKDSDQDGIPDESEVRSLLFYEEAPRAGAAPGQIERVRAALAKHDPPADERRRLIADENDQIRPILVHTDLKGVTAQEKLMVRHLLEATQAVDRLHARQKGLLAVLPQVSKLDPESRALFRRNWGPRCTAPRTENNPACTALPGVDKVAVDVYPAAMQSDAKFCAALEKNADAKKLFDPFGVVRDSGGKLSLVPYAEATTAMPDGSTTRYADDANAAATALESAARDLDGTSETAMATYLKAAAKAFRDNRWFDADAAWSKMSGKNSRYYLRVAPDETYWEPCAQKAGFHVSFARVSEASLAWQERLEPVKQSMEETIAKAIGTVYPARKVTFHLPEFIDIIWNGGDSRDAVGATIGQSLPNWGPVAAKGQGRTVAMANLYTDDDSLASRKRISSSLLCASTMPYYPEGREPGLVATILHEATHNLGPSQEYKYKGKTDAQWFGGGLASTMEELKAQTGALFFLDLLRSKGVIDEKLQRSSAVDSLTWAFGHISRGMVTPSGERKPYSQLAAIQVGMLMEDGAVTFDESQKAANGRDAGCFAMDWAKFPPAATRMMSEIGRLKATGDKKGAEALAAKHVDAAKKHDVIRERMLREPRPSFVYAVDLD